MNEPQNVKSRNYFSLSRTEMIKYIPDDHFDGIARVKGEYRDRL